MNKEKLSQIEEKRQHIIKLKKEVVDDSYDLFNEFCSEIFNKCERLESFGWSQYTPYFNDGDTCIFSANTEYLYINGDSFDEAEWYSETNVTDWGKWNSQTRQYEGRVEVSNPNYDPDLAKITDEISQFLGNFDNDFFLSKFGDHAEIVVTKSGISVSECDHD
jgi:hypothetical protein